MKILKLLLLGALLASSGAEAHGQTVELARKAVVFDFKDDGYYTTIPFIALQDGLFFISDNSKHRVLAYRFQGDKMEFLRAIGQPGQGPGDLMRPMEIGFSGGRLAVSDEHGISFFGPDGKFKGRFRLLSKSITMLYRTPEVYVATFDSGSPDLVQAYSEAGEMPRSFLDKRSLHPLRYDIHKGLSPDMVERIVFDGVLRSGGSALYYLSRRFGDFVEIGRSGNDAVKKDLAPLLSDNERAKVEENRRLFLDDGFDLIKNRRMVPNLYLFNDAQIRDGRLYLLLDGWDIRTKKAIPTIEFVEIDIAAWRVVNTYTAEAATNRESAANFVMLDSGESPAFLTRLRDPGDDDKICVFRPARKKY